MPIRVSLLGNQSTSLHELLGELPAALELRVVGEHADRKSAEESLRTDMPDVALVSAHLQDGSGFELIASLEPASRPVALVFLSAREEDAVRAFELQATDFVPVPIVPARLREALVRARQVVLHSALLRTADELQRLVGAVEWTPGLRDSAGSFVEPPSNGHAARGAAFSATAWNSGEVASVLGVDIEQDGDWRAAPRNGTPGVVAAASRLRTSDDAALDLSAAPAGLRIGTGVTDGRPTRVLVREGRRTCFVPLNDVDWFEADGNYIVVHSGSQAYRTRGTITAIEAVLDPRQFARIHRRIVVNMDRVREMSPLPGGDGLLMLGDGVMLRLSRTYRARVR